MDLQLIAFLHSVNANLAPQKRISIPNFLSPDPSVPLDTLPQFQPKALSAEAAAALSTAAVNLAAWNENDTPKRILLQRRISHPRTMERYWPEVARQLDEELGSAIKLKL
jgi:isopenicillin N synthase-like dioxygenase